LVPLLSVKRINNYKLIDGVYNALKLIEYLDETWNKQVIRSNDILIMDNAMFHNTFDLEILIYNLEIWFYNLEILFYDFEIWFCNKEINKIIKTKKI